MTDAIFGNVTIRACLDDPALCSQMIRVEIALARAQAELGVIPAEAAGNIASRLSGASPDLDRLKTGVAEAGVPVPALVGALRAELRPEDADWLHYGATSQDIVDTAFCLCFGVALDHVETRLAQVIDTLYALANRHAETLMLARTRGQLATPITFGLRAAQWAQPLIALEAETPDVRSSSLRVQLGGASGSRSVFGDKGGDLAGLLARHLGLADSPPWHTDRSGLRRLANWLSRTTSATAKIGRDFALSARGEIGELRAAKGGGSSTMPHKSNPVTAEALQSLVAIGVACEAALAASGAHSEERDGALWPVEWVMMPLLFEATGAALDHAGKLLEGMQVEAETMNKRIDDFPEVRAEAAVFALAQKLGRVEASRLVAETLASGSDLTSLFELWPEADLEESLSDAAFAAPSAELVQRIFSQRRNSEG